MFIQVRVCFARAEHLERNSAHSTHATNGIHLARSPVRLLFLEITVVIINALAVVIITATTTIVWCNLHNGRSFVYVRLFIYIFFHIS